MSECSCAASYADRACFGRVLVEENVQIARDTYRVRLAAEQIAGRIVPGQFVMLRLADRDDPLLGRPLALYDVINDEAGNPRSIDIVYLTVGKMTQRLATIKPTEPLDVWGPLGNGFPPRETQHLVMVAGGIGQTPFPALAREYLGLAQFGDPPRKVPRAEKVTLCYGAKTAEYLAGLEDFRRLGVDVRISTDDGSQGHHGLVTELIRPAVEQSALTPRIVCCGPEPMMRATVDVARQMDIPCQVSLENPMACGIGICFSCVAKVRDESGHWDYRRTCVEGPVFDAADVEI